MSNRFLPSLALTQLLLRLALGITYAWFGILKLFDVSPVGPLIQASYSFVPFEPFQLFIGLLEVIIGIGFLIGKKLSWVVSLMILQLGGVFTSVLLAPQRFYQDGNILALTLEGEFMIKNFVLLTAALLLLRVANGEQHRR